MNGSTVFKIKDSVDLFLSNDAYLVAYYMNTRQRKCFKVNSNLKYLIETIDGKKKLDEIYSFMKSLGINGDDVDRAIVLMKKNRIISEVIYNQNIIDPLDYHRYSRQINYFSEFFEDEKGGIIAQKKLMDSKVLIFGCGAIGGDIALELAMAGVGNIYLYDYDFVEKSDVSRHMFYSIECEGLSKVETLAQELVKINPKIHVDTINQSMKPNTDIEKIISKVDLVVNTLDEPYIGYTSSKISRVCMKYNKAHYIAGGFDAHLASTGELIIPYVTPCVECYAKHFKKVLKDWKPSQHPVKLRYTEIGGLASMSLFSSSYACVEIIKYLTGIIDLGYAFKNRGEFLFTDMSLTYLDVKKDPNCPVCGGNSDERS